MTSDKRKKYDNVFGKILKAILMVGIWNIIYPIVGAIIFVLLIYTHI